MDFELGDDQVLLQRGLRELIDRACDIRRVRAIAYDGGGSEPDLWRAIAEAGWTAIAVPEADGGAGMRFEDVMLVIEEAGRAALPVPLTTTLLASRAVASAPERPLRGELLSRIVDGSARVTLALRGSPGDRVGAEPPVVAQREGSQSRLSGSIPFVPYGPLATTVLVEAEVDGRRGLFAVEAGDAAWTDLDTLDRTAPLFEIALDGTSAESLFGEQDAGPAIDGLLDEWRAALAAETLGASERMVEMSVAYAKERVQFDRPIGANQAVKARIAEMGATVERMRAAVYHAAVKIDADAEDRPLAVAMAKAATSAPGNFVGSQAVHVHGGIGYTWEHDLHIYFKRVKSNELLLGDEQASLERVAAAVL